MFPYTILRETFPAVKSLHFVSTLPWNMELVTEPDMYCPSIDDIGNYIDHIPPFVRGGIRCSCGSRKNQVYDTRAVFSQHYIDIGGGWKIAAVPCGYV